MGFALFVKEQCGPRGTVLLPETKVLDLGRVQDRSTDCHRRSGTQLFINCNYQPGQRSLQEPCQEHNFRAIELIVLTLSICFFRVVVPPFVPSLRSSITHSFPCSACHQLQIADPCNARNVRKRWAFPERVTTKYIRGPGLWVWVKRLEFRGSGCCVSGLPIPSTAIQLVAILKDPKEKLARVEPKGSTWRL